MVIRLVYEKVVNRLFGLIMFSVSLFMFRYFFSVVMIWLWLWVIFVGFRIIMLYCLSWLVVLCSYGKMLDWMNFGCMLFRCELFLVIWIMFLLMLMLIILEVLCVVVYMVKLLVL